MSLYKVAVTYVTKAGNHARATMMLCASDQQAATKSAHVCVQACSAEGVQEFRAAVVTFNSLGVEFLGRQPR